MATRRGSSQVWGPHGFYRPAAGENHVTCRKCGVKIAYRDSSYGTSTLKRNMKSKKCLRTAAQQQQQQQVAPVVGEPFQPSGLQVHYSTTAATDVVVNGAAELHHLLPPAPTAAAGSFQPGGEDRAAVAAALADPRQLHGHGGVAEGSGAHASENAEVHQTAASSTHHHRNQPSDFLDLDSDA